MTFSRALACAGVVVMTACGSALLCGCAVHLPFNHRVGYTTLSEANDLAFAAPPVSIAWLPADFVDRVDSVSPSGFVGAATLARIPTGQALGGRITEVLDHVVGVAPGEKRLTIVVLEVKTEYAYSASLLNADLAIDRARCVLEVELRHGRKRWTERFEAEVIDEHIGGASVTGALERAWDRVALDVGRSVAAHTGGV